MDEYLGPRSAPLDGVEVFRDWFSEVGLAADVAAEGMGWPVNEVWMAALVVIGVVVLVLSLAALFFVWRIFSWLLHVNVEYVHCHECEMDRRKRRDAFDSFMCNGAGVCFRHLKRGVRGVWRALMFVFRKAEPCMEILIRAARRRRI